LRLVIEGKLKLYEYLNKYNNDQFYPGSISNKYLLYYFIEIENELILINDINYTKILANILSENQSLVSKILNDEYKAKNIYLIVKYFNESE